MQIKRRDVLKSIGAITASSAFHPAQAGVVSKKASHSKATQPNILVFLSDDHAQWLQKAYGNSEVLTPNMARIAQKGVRMQNAFTPCPVCSPARASFFTGRMPSQHGIHDWIEETKQAYAYNWLQGEILISSLLKDAGYNTGLVGKWHCGEEHVPHPGFNYWFSYWVNQYPHKGKQSFSDNGKQLTVDGFQSPFFTERALDFLKAHYAGTKNNKQPFFLFVGYTDTHAPHSDMPDDLVSGYNNATFRDIPDESFLLVHGTASNPVSTDPKIEHAKRVQYYAAASSIDRQVGRILDHLESIGELDDTLVVYTSDHGLNAGQHGMWEKGNATMPQNFLEESIRVPCTLSWPNGGIPFGLESETLVNHCDLFATLLEAANALPDASTAKKINSPGRSYLSHLRGSNSNSWRDKIICEYGNARMIRKNSYKLILRYPYKDVVFANELYDLKADPRETTNLYSSPSLIHVQEELTTLLDNYFKQYTVPGHSGLDIDNQMLATPSSPWFQSVKINASANHS